MISLDMKSYNMILTEKQQKNHYNLEKFDKYEYLKGEEV